MGREAQLLSKSIGESFGHGRTAEHRLSHIMDGLTSDSANDPENNELHEANETLAYWINKIYRDLAILAELLSLPLFAKRIVEETPSKENVNAMEPTLWDVGLCSATLDKAQNFYNSLVTIAEGSAVSGLSVFQTILKNTPAIIRAKGIEPSSEAQVRKAVYEILQFAFHDAAREISVAQVMKVYKPDLGVRSLMAAAEYKFADNEQEVKKALDEIYTDMKGYSGHDDWRTFFAVIYTTDAIVHQDRLEAEFRGVKADINWTPIILVGKGDRKAKVKTQQLVRSRSPRRPR